MALGYWTMIRNTELLKMTTCWSSLVVVVSVSPPAASVAHPVL